MRAWIYRSTARKTMATGRLVRSRGIGVLRVTINALERTILLLVVWAEFRPAVASFEFNHAFSIQQNARNRLILAFYRRQRGAWRAYLDGLQSCPFSAPSITRLYSFCSCTAMISSAVGTRGTLPGRFGPTTFSPLLYQSLTPGMPPSTTLQI